MRRTSRARVLIVEQVEMEAKLLMRALADAGYTNLAHRSDVASAIVEIKANPPRLVITDIELPRSADINPAQPIRTLDKTAAIYILMLAPSRCEAVLNACFDAEEADFAEEPSLPPPSSLPMHDRERIELEASLSAKSRVFKVASEAPAPTAGEAAENGPASRAAPLDELLGTTTWRNVEVVLTKAMTDFFQLPFASQPLGEKSDAFVAEVSLSEPSKQLELGLSVVVENVSMQRLGAHLLGDEDLEGAQELVQEVANILMGTLKTAFTAHGFTFTGGLPTTETFAQSRTAFDRSPVRSRMAIAASDSDVELWLRVKEKRNTTIRGRALREGLVVGEDVHDALGMLLIKGGSRLTQTTAERLAQLVPDVEITVSDPNG